MSKKIFTDRVPPVVDAAISALAIAEDVLANTGAGAMPQAKIAGDARRALEAYRDMVARDDTVTLVVTGRGDRSVGINPISISVTLPAHGMDDEEYRENVRCELKAFLHEMVDDSRPSAVYSFECPECGGLLDPTTGQCGRDHGDEG